MITHVLAGSEMGAGATTVNLLHVVTVLVIDAPIVMVAAFCIVIIVKLGQFRKPGERGVNSLCG